MEFAFRHLLVALKKYDIKTDKSMGLPVMLGLVGKNKETGVYYETLIPSYSLDDRMSLHLVDSVRWRFGLHPDQGVSDEEFFEDVLDENTIREFVKKR